MTSHEGKLADELRIAREDTRRWMEECLAERERVSAGLLAVRRAREERDQARKDVKYLAEMLGVGYDTEDGSFSDGSLGANVGMFPEPMYDELLEQHGRLKAALERIAEQYPQAWAAAGIAREALEGKGDAD